MHSVEKFVHEGPDSLFPIANVSFGEVIYQSLLSNSQNHPALVNGHTRESLTFPQLLKETCSLAEAMRNAGFGPNTMVTISSKNNLQFFIPVIASLYIGATVATINHNYTSEELNHVLHITKPEVIFCSKDVIEKYTKLSEKLLFKKKLIIIDSDEGTRKSESLKSFVDRNILFPVSRIITTRVNPREAVAFVLCSSGTTGLPKGVMVTHRNINCVYNNLRDPRYVDIESVDIGILPFFHGYGLCTTLASITANRPTIFLDRFEPNTFLKCIADYKVTRLFLAPPVVVFLAKSPMVLNYDLSSVKEVISGAAPLKKSTEEDFKRRFNLNCIKQGYGLTESTLAVTLIGMNDKNLKPGSSGKVLPNSRIVIRDPESGEYLGRNKIGEICIKSDSVMKGYMGNPEATRNSFTDDGWLLTGDVGLFDEDGFIFITDRIKELIKYKGFQVAPAEVEACLLTHSEINDCGVVGVPDENAGELPLAFVVKSEKSKLTERDVQDLVKSKMSYQKWLRGGVIFIDAIPKNPSGKILRKELRLLLKQHKAKL